MKYRRNVIVPGRIEMAKKKALSLIQVIPHDHFGRYTDCKIYIFHVACTGNLLYTLSVYYNYKYDSVCYYDNVTLS